MKGVGFDLAALVARVAIGVIFIAHGWQKWQGGLDAVTRMFAQQGVPLPTAAATFATVAELVGGACLVLGLMVRVAALALVADMAGALVFVHAGRGVFVSAGGWELVAALGSACLLLVALGGGRVGIDALFARGARRRAAGRAAEREIERPMDIFDEPESDDVPPDAPNRS
ncbi:DoxX family protein [Nonomuraea sp. NPDC003727]